MPFSSSQVCNRQAGAGTLPETRPRGRKLNKTGRPLPITDESKKRPRPRYAHPSARRFVRRPWDDDPPMMKKSDVAWTLVGVSAVLLSGYLLYHEVRDISLTELADSLRAIGAGAGCSRHCRRWALMSRWPGMTALPWPIWARRFLGGSSRSVRSPPMRWRTTSARRCSPRAGALSGVSQQGLTPQEIGILIVFCSLTFTLGTLLAAGVVLILKPQLLDRLVHSAGWVSWPSAAGCWR